MAKRRYYEEDEPEHISGCCTSCGKPCTSITEDVGIGPYEFWGAKGTDIQLVETSPCCEASVFESPLPCHAGCLFYLDMECSKGITEQTVEGKGCPQFEPKE